MSVPDLSQFGDDPTQNVAPPDLSAYSSTPDQTAFADAGGTGTSTGYDIGTADQATPDVAPAPAPAPDAGDLTSGLSFADAGGTGGDAGAAGQPDEEGVMMQERHDWCAEDDPTVNFSQGEALMPMPTERQALALARLPDAEERRETWLDVTTVYGPDVPAETIEYVVWARLALRAHHPWMMAFLEMIGQQEGEQWAALKKGFEAIRDRKPSPTFLDPALMPFLMSDEIGAC